MAKRTKPQDRPSSPKCVALWERARDLCGQGITSLWERTKILCTLAGDEEFLRRFVGLDEQIHDVFQREALHDTTVSFAELQTVWEHFPDEATWQAKGLANLLAAAAERNATDETEPRTRVSWKARAAELEEEVGRLRVEMQRLQDENRELRKLVAQAEPVAA